MIQNRFKAHLTPATELLPVIANDARAYKKFPESDLMFSLKLCHDRDTFQVTLVGTLTGVQDEI